MSPPPRPPGLVSRRLRDDSVRDGDGGGGGCGGAQSSRGVFGVQRHAERLVHSVDDGAQTGVERRAQVARRPTREGRTASPRRRLFVFGDDLCNQTYPNDPFGSW